MVFDYIIAGAGSAGCVPADRPSADPDTRTLLIEAGAGLDRSRERACTCGVAAPKPPRPSGIGSAVGLKGVSVECALDRSNVGARMRGHRVFTTRVRLTTDLTTDLTADLGYNRRLGGVLRRPRAGRRYVLRRDGPPALPVCDLIAFVRTRPDGDGPARRRPHGSPGMTDLIGITTGCRTICQDHLFVSPTDGMNSPEIPYLSPRSSPPIMQYCPVSTERRHSACCP